MLGHELAIKSKRADMDTYANSLLQHDSGAFKEGRHLVVGACDWVEGVVGE